MSSVRKFLSELLRRKVVRVLGSYIAILWLLAEGFTSLFPALGVPNSDLMVRLFVVAGITGIPIVAFLSWKYDLVPPHLVRDPKDVVSTNPGQSWAKLRHDQVDAGYVLLRWMAEDGPSQEKRFFQPVSIGREPSNDIELPDQRVSRYHAVLWAEDGAWRVRDLDSSNGTFVDHMRVAGTAVLPQTCELRFHPNGPIVSVSVSKAPETLIG